LLASKIAAIAMPARHSFTHKKKNGASAPAGLDESYLGIEMTDFLDEVVVLKPSGQVFNMDEQSERERLAHTVWDKSIKINGEGSLRSCNPAITQVLDAITANWYRSRGQVQDAEESAELRIEAILSYLARVQSQKKLTVLCARFSMACYRIQVGRDVWQMLHAVAPGLLASFNWTEEFILYAMPFRPGPSYETLPGVGACMFDNYTRRVLYKSVATTDSSGYRLDMTNSLSMEVPRLCASEHFDAAAIGACTQPAAHSPSHDTSAISDPLPVLPKLL
jgi:hypothetical protein